MLQVKLDYAVLIAIEKDFKKVIYTYQATNLNIKDKWYRNANRIIVVQESDQYTVELLHIVSLDKTVKHKYKQKFNKRDLEFLINKITDC